MIGFRSKRTTQATGESPRGFDAFELRLGDVMRGERATLGKSLLDVERELRIKAAYVAAIENCDPDAFDTPGFIPGYVRSYARYLNMDPDQAFDTFCVESGFSIAHGMSAEASSIRRSDATPSRRQAKRDDPLSLSNTPFVTPSESFLSRIEPGAIGSALVLVLLIGGLGYGGWSVLNEVQRVQFAPVENTPDVLSDLDPLEGAVPVEPGATVGAAETTEATASAFEAPRDERLDRLYRPEALDVPVMIARDAPISTLDPTQGGAFGPVVPQADRSTVDYAGIAERGTAVTGVNTDTAFADPSAASDPLPVPQVLANQPAGVRMVAVRPAWVRVRGADGSVVFEGIMNAGDTYDVAVTEEAPTLRAGESGAIYFQLNGELYGPVGPRGSVTSGLPLDAEMLADALPALPVDTQEIIDQDLKRYVAELQSGVTVEPQE